MLRNIKWSKLSKLTIEVHVWPKSMDHHYHYQPMDEYLTVKQNEWDCNSVTVLPGPAKDFLPS